MARLEYEITGDASSLLSSVNQSLGAFGSLQDTYDRLSQKAQQAGADSLALQGEILSLKKSLDDGTISQAQYNQQLDQLSGFLRDTNGALAGYQQQLINVSKATQDLNATLINPDTSQLAGVNQQLTSLSGNLFGARRIAIDFTRAIAEAPVSVEGFARNLGLLAVDFLFYSQSAQFAGKATTAATAEIGAAQTATAATGGGLKNLGAAFTSLLTPINAVVLGIGILAAGYVLFEKNAQAATKASAEFVKEASKVGGTQLEPLKLLYDATQDLTLSTEKRLEAAQRLRETYPEEFANSSKLAILNGDLKKSYDDLTDSIVANAKSEAAKTEIQKSEGDIIAAQLKIDENNLAKAQKIRDIKPLTSDEISAQNRSGGGAVTIPDQIKQITNETNFANEGFFKAITKANDTINLLKGYIVDIDKAGEDLKKANALLGPAFQNFNDLISKGSSKQDFENVKKALEIELDNLAPSDSRIADLRAKILQVEEIIKNTYTVKIPGRGSSSNPFIAIGNTLDEIFNKTNKLANDSGLQGYALIVQKINDTYVKINTSLDQQQAKLSKLQSKDLSPKLQGEADADQAKLDRDRLSSQQAQAKDLSDAKIAEALRVANEIQRINDEFGVKAQAGRDTALLNIQKTYDKEVVKARGNKEILATLDANRLTAIKAIDEKYIQQAQDLYSKVADLSQLNADALGSVEENATGKINLQYAKRLQIAEKYFQSLRDLAKAGTPGLSVEDINAQQALFNKQNQLAEAQQVSIQISKPFSQALQTSITDFTTSFYTAITTLGAARQAIDDKYTQQYAAATSDLARKQIEQQRQIEQAATTSFSAVFSSVISSTFASFNKSIVDSFTKKFTENIASTLIKPSEDQLGLKASGVQFSSNVTTAAQTFSTIIGQAATNFALKSNPNALVAGGATQVAGGLNAAGLALSKDVTGAGVKTAASLIGAGAAAALTTKAAATTAATTTVNAAAQLSAKIAGAAAALSVVGSLVSGATKPTSSVGQGIGGALQGAGEGALIGSAVPVIGTVAGAIIGGTIGLISGLFSASKARKQEELQQQQLAQQQLTNELLARQNVLAYTSSIIGRMTTQGIITGTDINAFGQLTATVSGKSIQFVLDRSSNGR